MMKNRRYGNRDGPSSGVVLLGILPLQRGISVEILPGGRWETGRACTGSCRLGYE